MIEIREPVEADANRLGAIHVAAWDRAYRGGLLPDEYLDAMSVAERTSMWAEALVNPARTDRIRRVAVLDEAVVGFVLCGPEAGEEGAAWGEVYAINVHPEAWGLGAGSALMATAEAFLATRHERALLWVHPGNGRARRFYEGRGWRCEGTERVEDVLGATTAEVRYELDLRSG